jgi:hypothetical protein
MVSKRIDLGPGLIFGSISAAKVHFDPTRAKGLLDADISKGQFSEMKMLYEKYCLKTNYPIPSPVAAFYPTMEKRNGGNTRCMGVRFQYGSATTFSLDKALSAVAQ